MHHQSPSLSSALGREAGGRRTVRRGSAPAWCATAIISSSQASRRAGVARSPSSRCLRRWASKLPAYVGGRRILWRSFVGPDGQSARLPPT